MFFHLYLDVVKGQPNVLALESNKVVLEIKIILEKVGVSQRWNKVESHKSTQDQFGL